MQHRNTENLQSKAVDDMLNKINHEIMSGMKHGFFRCEIKIAMLSSGRREIILEAGKSHKFHVSPEEIKSL
jgi:hypothetical protein